MDKYLITGATGYIGSQIIKFITSNSNEDLSITVIVRNIKKAEQLLPPFVKIVELDLANDKLKESLGVDFDYIIHCASITKSSYMVQYPVQVIESIVNTTQNICELARHCPNLKGIICLSSMEVYGSMDCSDGHKTTEEEVGEGVVDVLNARSCYPLGKRMSENICYSYFREYSLPIKIARLAQTFGQGVLSTDKRVFAQFAKSVIEEKDIILHTDGKSTGNYVEINDAVKAILLILKEGNPGEAYNVVNEECTMTIRQMAELVAQEIAMGKIKLKFDIPEENTFGYATPTGLRLSGSKLQKLGWQPTASLVDMYREMIGTMKKEV